MPESVNRARYVQRVLALYRRAPGITGHLRRSDRQLAGLLHDRGIPLQLVFDALVLGVARRTFRKADAPLSPIATLHYFRPVIEELLAEPPDAGYIRYLISKLTTIAPAFTAAINHQLP